MRNNVRVISAENVVTNACIEVRGSEEDDEWVDIRRSVSGLKALIKVGEVPRIQLDLILANVDIEGQILMPDEELQHSIAILRAMDFVVTPRWDTVVGYFITNAQRINYGRAEAWELWSTAHTAANRNAFDRLWDDALAARDPKET